MVTVYAKEVGSLEATTDKVTYLTVGDQKIFTANKAGVTWISEQSEVATDLFYLFRFSVSSQLPLPH